MRKKIQHSMILVITTTLLIAYAITTLVLYRHTMKIMETQIRQEAGYIYAAIEVSGESYMEVLDSVEKNTRITLINEQGIVEYDSAENGKTVLENHKDRPEVKAAMKTGSGQDIRQSNTVGKEMFYYAEKLPDGKILRVSKTMDTISRTALMILPSMGVIAVVMLLFAWLFAKWQVSRLIRPINELDLNEPLQNHEVYEELNPLLERIDQQNKEKDAIADMRKEFSANVSHELKTPLTSISGYAEIMKNGLVKPEDIPRFSDRIYQEARRLITLVEDIIKLSKLDEDKIELEREDVDLYQLTKEICTRLSPQLNAKNVHMSVIGEPVKIRIHHIEVAGQDVEVIEPVDSPNAYLTKFLETHGDCFHHLALTFEKHAEHLSMCKILTAQGYRCVFEARVRDLLVNYYESSDNSGIALELKSVVE